MKKILLYSQNDKNLEGFKELSQALQLLQDSRSGRTRRTSPPLWKPEQMFSSLPPHKEFLPLSQIFLFLCLRGLFWWQACCSLQTPPTVALSEEGVSSGVLTW